MVILREVISAKVEFREGLFSPKTRSLGKCQPMVSIDHGVSLCSLYYSDSLGILARAKASRILHASNNIDVSSYGISC